jgi:Fe2+ or Zn2+ uptake regulation protein
MKKFRLTPTRSQLLKIFQSSSYPISAEQILKKIPVNKTTVYRQLETLANQGLIKPIVFSDRTTRYESSQLSHHHHLICTRCNQVTDIIIPENIETKAKSVASETKFRIQSHNLEFFGLCKNCQ